MVTKTDATKTFLSRCLWLFILCLLSYSVFDVIVSITAQLEHKPPLVDLNISVFQLLIISFLLQLSVYALQLLYLVWMKHVSWSRWAERRLVEPKPHSATSFALADPANPGLDRRKRSAVEGLDLELAKRSHTHGEDEVSQAFTQHKGLKNEEKALHAPLDDPPQDIEALPQRLSVVLGLWAGWLDGWTMMEVMMVAGWTGGSRLAGTGERDGRCDLRPAAVEDVAGKASAMCKEPFDVVFLSCYRFPLGIDMVIFRRQLREP